MKSILFTTAIFSIITLSACESRQTDKPATSTTKASLGSQIFNDISLSRDGTQSCASCHNLSNNAANDTRINASSINAKTPGAVSLGQDGRSLGDINTPDIRYAKFIPDFHFDKKEGLFIGGLFLDGRAKNLVAQAKQPFLNPVEMQTTAKAVVAKIKQKYQKQMQFLYGKTIFNNEEKAFEAIAQSLVAFQNTADFSLFNSKFDQVLAGKATFNKQELLGKDVFEDEKKGNCAACHPVPTQASSPAESLLTDFSYDNLGVPSNLQVRRLNGKGKNFVDNGLFNNPNVNDANLKGAFRVAGLRNIANSAPYMHNGVFKDLKTVVHFYNTRDVKNAVNPETNKPWRVAEVDKTKNIEELGDLGLSEEEEDAIVAFLQTLSDR
ncbi:cytochrome-c peroxidase [Candidatus Thioglobus sp.]|uniref:cytochrome-c peroxidase n=1 Tax=Candidatus Thioglobus sp. TaxID=2026721 RepID=UPI003D0D3CA2